MKFIKQYLLNRQKIKFAKEQNKAINKGAYLTDSDATPVLTQPYMVDFRGSYNSGNIANAQGTPITTLRSSNKNIESKIISITPKQVLNELERVETSWSLVGLDEKIKLLQEKKELISQNYTKMDVESLIERLQNRKKYNKMGINKKTFAEYFRQFDITNQQKIDTLLKKYPNLVMKNADIFIPEFPKDAIKTMKEMTNAFKLLCNKKPLFFVISTENDFVKKYEKRDPILLVQSPFGLYYFILGAWDEEMELLSEL